MKIKGLTPTILVMNDSFYLPYVLEALRGRFHRYVIYDAGSEDGTENIIDWFTETEDAEFFVRKLPFAVPSIQGCYRNSMLAEAETDWTFMVDGDEIYPTESLDNLITRLSPKSDRSRIGVMIESLLYGVVRRTEIDKSLLQKYSDVRGHHRLYRQGTYFKGNHPGEAPAIKQTSKNEFQIDDVMCWHFHNALRSPLEGSVPKRLDRKGQGTYHPGDLEPFDLLKELPSLREPINNFQVSPDLEKLQRAVSKM
jgi:hypothetical protein